MPLPLAQPLLVADPGFATPREFGTGIRANKLLPRRLEKWVPYGCFIQESPVRPGLSNRSGKEDHLYDPRADKSRPRAFRTNHGTDLVDAKASQESPWRGLVSPTSSPLSALYPIPFRSPMTIARKWRQCRMFQRNGKNPSVPYTPGALPRPYPFRRFPTDGSIRFLDVPGLQG